MNSSASGIPAPQEPPPQYIPPGTSLGPHVTFSIEPIQPSGEYLPQLEVGPADLTHVSDLTYDQRQLFTHIMNQADRAGMSAMDEHVVQLVQSSERPNCRIMKSLCCSPCCLISCVLLAGVAVPLATIISVAETTRLLHCCTDYSREDYGRRMDRLGDMGGEIMRTFCDGHGAEYLNNTILVEAGICYTCGLIIGCPCAILGLFCDMYSMT